MWIFVNFSQRLYKMEDLRHLSRLKNVFENEADLNKAVF